MNFKKNDLTQKEEQELLLIEASQIRSNFSWRSPFGPLYQLPLLAIFLVGIFAPEDVLSRYPLAAWFAGLVRSTLLQVSDYADINNFATSTDYPQIALLICALHWVWLAVSVFLSAVIFEYVRAREGYVVWRFGRNGKGSVGWADLKMLIGGLVLFPSALIVLTMIPGDWSMTSGLITTNRVGMALLFWIGFWISAVVIGTIYPTLRAFIDINLKGR
jgi:hypothetical protein